MWNLYESYFDPKTVSEDCRNRYIAEKFGKCEEPTYDPLWRVWYLGHIGDNGEVQYYDIGSATEILGKFLGCYISGIAVTKNAEGDDSYRVSGSMEFLFGEAWSGRQVGYKLRLKDENLLSEKEKELWDKVIEYPGANHR